MLRIPTWIGLIVLFAFLTRTGGTAATLVRLRRLDTGRTRLPSMRAPAAIVLAVLCTALPLAGQFYGDSAGGWMMVDFRAYYCAALAQRENRNPYYAYVAASMRGEHAAALLSRLRKGHRSRALSALRAGILLSADLAAVRRGGGRCGGCAFCARRSRSRSTRWRARPVNRCSVAWAALALSLGPGLADDRQRRARSRLAAVAVAALAAQQNRIAVAVCAIGVAAIEPQIALPAALGLFVVVPQARRGLVLVAAFFAALVDRDGRHRADVRLRDVGASRARTLRGRARQPIQHLDGFDRARRARLSSGARGKHRVRHRAGRRAARRACASRAATKIAPSRCSFRWPSRCSADRSCIPARSPRRFRPRFCSYADAGVARLALGGADPARGAVDARDLGRNVSRPALPRCLSRSYTLWRGDRTAAFAAALASFATIPWNQCAGS